MAPLDFSYFITSSTDFISLALVLASTILMGFLAFRARTVSSFQFQMLVVLLVVALAEVPHILNNLGVLDVSGIENLGLFLHTISMFFLAYFVAIRVTKYFREGGSAK
jgi:hypothetical protein